MLEPSLEEIVAMDNIAGPRALQDQVSYILTGLAIVPIDKAHAFYEALGKAWKENDEDYDEAVCVVLEDEEMGAIDDALWTEVCERLEIPIEEPNETLIDYLSEAYEDALEEVVINHYSF